jgi:hypothetical protein
MTGTIKSTARRLAAVAVLSAMLVTTSAAYADTTMPPDRVDRIGVAPRVAAPQLPPDRADGLGSARLPYVPVPTVIVRTTGSDGFNWADAAAGAASAVAVLLLAAVAITARRRRHVALPS